MEYYEVREYEDMKKLIQEIMTAIGLKRCKARENWMIGELAMHICGHETKMYLDLKSALAKYKEKQ